MLLAILTNEVKDKADFLGGRSFGAAAPISTSATSKISGIVARDLTQSAHVMGNKPDNSEGGLVFSLSIVCCYQSSTALPPR
jgi:hypothetical protein